MHGMAWHGKARQGMQGVWKILVYGGYLNQWRILGSDIYIILIHLSMRLSVEVLKPISLFKLSPRTRGPKNYSEPQSHTFTYLLTESRVLSPNQSRSQISTPKFQITYWGAYGQRAEW
jgi:hypothetical protein